MEEFHRIFESKVKKISSLQIILYWVNFREILIELESNTEKKTPKDYRILSK